MYDYGDALYNGMGVEGGHGRLGLSLMMLVSCFCVRDGIEVECNLWELNRFRLDLEIS